jgi:hypothetical protein
MGLCVDLSFPPVPRAWVRVIWLVVIVVVAHLAGVSDDVLLLILGGGVATGAVALPASAGGAE